jgi:hypothetical protein
LLTGLRHSGLLLAFCSLSFACTNGKRAPEKSASSDVATDEVPKPDKRCLDEAGSIVEEFYDGCNTCRCEDGQPTGYCTMLRCHNTTLVIKRDKDGVIYLLDREAPDGDGNATEVTDETVVRQRLEKLEFEESEIEAAVERVRSRAKAPGAQQ